MKNVIILQFLQFLQFFILYNFELQIFVEITI